MTNSPPPDRKARWSGCSSRSTVWGSDCRASSPLLFPMMRIGLFFLERRKELSEGSELGEGQSSSTAEVRGDVDETSADPNTEFSVDQTNNAASQTIPNQDSTGSGAAGSSQAASNQEGQNSGTATNASASSGGDSSTSGSDSDLGGSANSASDSDSDSDSDDQRQRFRRGGDSDADG